jgi:hypothetical protein
LRYTLYLDSDFSAVFDSMDIDFWFVILI